MRGGDFTIAVLVEHLADAEQIFLHIFDTQRLGPRLVAGLELRPFRERDLLVQRAMIAEFGRARRLREPQRQLAIAGF